MLNLNLNTEFPWLQSVFSSMKNYFAKPSEPAKKTSDSSLPKSSSSGSGLSKVLEQNSSQMDREPHQQQPHPALRLKGLENDFGHKPLSNVDEQLEQDLGKFSKYLKVCQINTILLLNR